MRHVQLNMGTTKALRTASGNLAARRGSTLILVVATLALLAVLTVAYVSIGGGDRRSARTTTRAAEVERQAQHVADYLVGIVGDDALAVYFEGFDPAGEPIFMTEAVDLPRTDPNRTFDGQAVGGTPEPQITYQGRAFTPVGTLPALRPGDNPGQSASSFFSDLLPFGPSDPFLAASEPTYIRRSGDSFSTPAYLDRVDWPKISNISPNGLYVNLHNLRQDFDAEPGVGAGQMSDPATMFLTDRNGNPTRNLVYGGTADPRIPAHYDSMLVGAYQPINFMPSGVQVDDPENPNYMWADADGDGFRDARFQELVDVTVPGSAGTFIPRYVVPSEGQLRWFVAVRIEDLSSRVNVNTARGLLQPLASGTGTDGAPTTGNRLGASPADIDIRRLFTLENAWAQYGVFYDEATQPAGGAQDYSGYDSFAVAKSVGDEGTWGMRRVLAGEHPPAGPITPGVAPQTADERRDEYAQFRRGGDVPLRSDEEGVYRSFAFGMEDLAELLAYKGLNNPQSLTSLERATGGRSTSGSNFGPMRDNRSLQWERDLSDADAALALRHASVRQHLTTLSGGIPRVPSRVRYSSASPSALDVFTSFSSLPESTVARDPADENPVVQQDGYRLLVLGAPSDLPSTGGAAEATARRDRNAHPLFRTYANALLPAAGEPGSWSTAEWAPTFYGFNWLFSLRTAAHMTANMIDAFDGDDIPSAFTVLVQGDSATRATLESDPTARDVFPWWSEPEPSSTNPGVSGRLDLGEERLPTPGESGDVVAMNVYGLEVHPFITQVALYNVFTDSPAPPQSQGDADFVPPTGPGGGPIFGPGGGSSGPVTINFDTDLTNSDFVGQVLSVQIANPYTTDIEVRAGQYYVRFGELGGPAAAPALADGLEIPAGTRIPAGESVVLYYDSTDFPQRASDAAAAFFDVTTDQVDSWLSLHITGGPNGDPIRFNPPNASVDDFLAGPPGGTSGDSDANREVTLWTRLTRSSGFTDVMLDRLYDPAALNERPTLDRRPPATNLDIDSTVAGPETGTAAEALDNTGFSIVTWGTIARPRGVAMAPLGALPAYVLEKPFNEFRMSLNAASTDDVDLPAPLTPGFSLNRGHFVGGGTNRIRSAERALLDVFSDAGGSTMGSSGQIPQILTDIPLQVTDPAHTIRLPVEPVEQTRGAAFSDLYVNPLRNDNRGELDVSSTEKVRMLRPGDFLGVPALGPVQMPASFNGSVDPIDLDWFTTGELLTLALGYDEAPSINAPLYYPGLPEDTFSLLDRGHLSLNLPAPFVDLDNSGSFTAGDERRGLGVPHAMAVVSSITTLDVPVNTRTPIAGLINLNTATEAATSVLPGLTPSYESTIDPSMAWMTDGTVLHDHRSDVAAGIRSYRDKSGARPRTGSPVPFHDPSAWGDSDPQDLVGRQNVTGILGLREHTGLLSVGEVLAADPLPTGGPVLGPGGYPRQHMIRRLGQDQRSLGVDGVDAVRYTATGEVDRATGTPGFVDDGVADDYDELLALYNGVANSVTVRSDVYAIWFVLHGYAREDVEGLRPDDPMTPSVARRYLIVVDRSNVRRAGDKPRVLLFDELPL